MSEGNYECDTVTVLLYDQPTHTCTCTFLFHKHTPLSELIVLQDRHSLVSASRRGDEATVTSLLDSGADPDFNEIVRKESRIL